MDRSNSGPQGYSAPLMGGSSEPGSRGNKPVWKRAVRKVYKTLTQPEKDESGQRIPITRSISQRLNGSSRSREGRASGFFTPRSSTSSVPMLDKPGPHSARSSENEFAETARTAPLPYMSPFPSPIKPPSHSGLGSEPLETPRPTSDSASKESSPGVYINPRHAGKRAAAAQTAASKRGGSSSNEAPRPSTAPMKTAAEAEDAAAGAGAQAAKRALPDTEEAGQQAKRAHEEVAPTKAGAKAAVVPSEADQAGAAEFQAKVESGESDPSFKFKAATAGSPPTVPQLASPDSIESTPGAACDPNCETASLLSAHAAANLIAGSSASPGAATGGSSSPPAPLPPTPPVSESPPIRSPVGTPSDASPPVSGTLRESCWETADDSAGQSWASSVGGPPLPTLPEGACEREGAPLTDSCGHSCASSAAPVAAPLSPLREDSAGSGDTGSGTGKGGAPVRGLAAWLSSRSPFKGAQSHSPAKSHSPAQSHSPAPLPDPVSAGAPTAVVGVVAVPSLSHQKSFSAPQSPRAGKGELLQPGPDRAASLTCAPPEVGGGRASRRQPSGGLDLRPVAVRAGEDRVRGYDGDHDWVAVSGALPGQRVPVKAGLNSTTPGVLSPGGDGDSAQDARSGEAVADDGAPVTPVEAALAGMDRRERSRSLGDGAALPTLPSAEVSLTNWVSNVSAGSNHMSERVALLSSRDSGGAGPAAAAEEGPRAATLSPVPSDAHATTDAPVATDSIHSLFSDAPDAALPPTMASFPSTYTPESQMSMDARGLQVEASDLGSTLATAGGSGVKGGQAAAMHVCGDMHVEIGSCQSELSGGCARPGLESHIVAGALDSIDLPADADLGAADSSALVQSRSVELPGDSAELRALVSGDRPRSDLESIFMALSGDQAQLEADLHALANAVEAYIDESHLLKPSLHKLLSKKQGGSSAAPSAALSADARADGVSDALAAATTCSLEGDEQPGKRKFGVTRRLLRMALAVSSVAVAAVAFGVIKIGE